jgi:hypothetical protein
MRRFSILLFFMLSSIQWSFSQGEFLLRGQSGCGGGLGFSTNRDARGLNFFAGYSYRGILDANLTYAKENGGIVQDGIISPGITYYFVKQEDAENIPTLGVSIGFSHYTSKKSETVIVPDSFIVSWRSYERVTELTINALNLGVTAQSKTGSWKVFFFQPLLGAGFSITHAGWEFTLRGGISIGTRVVHGPLFILTPSVERQSGLTTLIITFGAVF